MVFDHLKKYLENKKERLGTKLLFLEKKRQYLFIAGLMLLLALSAILALTINLANNKKSFNLQEKAAETTYNFQVEIGEEEAVITAARNPQISRFLDTAPPVVKMADGRLRIFLSESNTYAYTLNSSEDLGNVARWRSEGMVLPKGNGNNFDTCGAWLNSVYKDPNNPRHWIGWYHAEIRPNNCNSTDDIKTMAFVESFDEGLHWIKGTADHPYPQNQVIKPPEENLYLDAGDAHVIKIGDYFYMFSMGGVGGDGYHLSRSLVSDEGKPGTWFNYSKNDGWNQPGLGGNSNPIPNIYNYAVYNSYLGKYISIMATGRWGFRFNYTPSPSNLLSWQSQLIYPLVSTSTDSNVDRGGNGDRQDTRGYYNYAWIISPDGDTETVGQEFYLYYMKIFPNEGFEKRNLLRRKIKIHENRSTIFSKIPLIEYRKGNKTQTSTELPNPSENYQKTGYLGYLAGQRKEGFVPLWDCYIENWDDHMLTLGTLDPANPGICPTDPNASVVRNIGFIAQTPRDGANLPLYRCFDEENLNHFVDTTPDCRGKKKEFLMGYIFSSFETPSCPPPPAVIQIGPHNCITNNKPSFTIIDQEDNCVPHDGIILIRKDVNGNGMLDNASSEDILVAGSGLWKENAFDPQTHEYTFTPAEPLADGAYIWRGYSRNTNNQKSLDNDFISFRICANPNYECSNNTCQIKTETPPSPPINSPTVEPAEPTPPDSTIISGTPQPTNTPTVKPAPDEEQNITPTPTTTRPTPTNSCLPGPSQTKNAYIPQALSSTWGVGEPLKFQANQTGILDKVDLYLSWKAPSSIEVKITDEQGNNISNTVRQSLSGTSPGKWITFDLTTEPLLQSNKNYIITFRKNYGDLYVHRGIYWNWAYKTYFKSCQ